MNRDLLLPEFCLTQLWEKQRCRQITHVAYQDIGGVQQAVAVYADEVYSLFNAEDKERVRHVFLKLVRPGQGTEDTRQAATFEEFKSEYHGLIKKLANLAILCDRQDTESQKGTVEVVHEALIRYWATLALVSGWTRNGVSGRQDNLKMRWRQWRESSQDEGALMRGVPLDQALNWQKAHLEDLSSDLLNFINESEQLRERKKKAKEEAEQERKKLFSETQYNLAKAFEEKSLTALKAAEKAGVTAYKEAVLLAWASLTKKIQEILRPWNRIR